MKRSEIERLRLKHKSMSAFFEAVDSGVVDHLIEEDQDPTDESKPDAPSNADLCERVLREKDRPLSAKAIANILATEGIDAKAPSLSAALRRGEGDKFVREGPSGHWRLRPAIRQASLLRFGIPAGIDG